MYGKKSNSEELQPLKLQKIITPATAALQGCRWACNLELCPFLHAHFQLIPAQHRLNQLHAAVSSCRLLELSQGSSVDTHVL